MNIKIETISPDLKPRLEEIANQIIERSNHRFKLIIVDLVPTKEILFNFYNVSDTIDFEFNYVVKYNKVVNRNLRDTVREVTDDLDIDHQYYTRINSLPDYAENQVKQHKVAISWIYKPSPKLLRLHKLIHRL